MQHAACSVDLPVEEDDPPDHWDDGEQGEDEDWVDEGEPDEEGEGTHEAADHQDHVQEEPRHEKPPGKEVCYRDDNRDSRAVIRFG